MRADDGDLGVGELVRRAYARRVDVDTAARHLWTIDTRARAARRARRTRRRAAVSVLSGFMIFVSSGVAVAASDAALPGDALYAVKRGSEQVRLAVAVRPQADARVHLAIAHARWAETQRAARARPEAVAGLLVDTFTALEAAERAGGAVAERALALRTLVSGRASSTVFAERGSRTGPGVASPTLSPAGPPADVNAPAGVADGLAAPAPAAPAPADSEVQAPGVTPPPTQATESETSTSTVITVPPVIDGQEDHADEPPATVTEDEGPAEPAAGSGAESHSAIGGKAVPGAGDAPGGAAGLREPEPTV